MNKQQWLAAAAVIFFGVTPALASEAGSWFLRPYVGISFMSDLDSDFDNIDGLSGEAEVELSDGFNAGLGVGYRYSENFALEIGWEYRSNDSETTLADISEFDEGNYASNLISLNAHYLFDKNDKWQPYVGGGITLVEEVDIDLERGGDEISYSGDGEVGFQVFAGINYDLNETWKLQGEVRYGSVTDIDLDGEDVPGEFEGIDYETTTLQIGLVYDF